MKLLRQYSPLLPAASWTLDQEVFEDEHTMASPQGTAATHTCYPAIRSRLGRDFDPNHLILGPAVRTIERHRLWIRHMRRPRIADHLRSKESRPIGGQTRDRQFRLEQRNLDTEHQ